MERKAVAEKIQNKHIDLKELLSDLDAINPDKFKEKGNVDGIELYFITKDKPKDDKYIYEAYSPSISKDIQKEIKKITTKRIKKTIKLIEEKEFVQDYYNPSGQVDGVIEECHKTFIKNIEDVISSFTQDNQLKKMVNVNDIHTYCFDFKRKDKRIIAFRRFTKMRRLREGFLGTLIDGTFTKIAGELLGVDSDVDLILYEDRVLILNHTSLERIFDLEEQFKNQARETINIIEKQDIILNFEDFEKDVLGNIPAIKRLTKIKANETLPLFFKNFDKVVEVSKAFGLGITFNEDESKIIYEDKSQLTEITLLMNDAYYKTLIGGQRGTDKLK